MKKTLVQIGGIICGIALGFVVTGTSFAATTVTPGDPYIYPGQSGSRVSGGNTTGRFGSLQQVGLELIRFIEQIIVPLIMSLALLAFLWGILRFISKGNDPKEREQGRQFMLWGIIGLAVMTSVWGLVRMLTNSIGVPLGIPNVGQIE